MSGIDSRVVQLKFENSQFENGVKTSIKTLEGLNKSLKLDDASKSLSGLSGILKNLGLGNVGDALDKVASKFSIFGAIGFSVIQDLTRRFLDLGGKMLSAITGPLIEGGKKRALSIEQAKFQFKGLGLDVDKTMASALAAVKGTAFGLDEAATAAALFGASGMKAGDQMTKSLRGIAGVAAQSGSSYADIADVFTKIAGQGRLMGDDLNRLASRGINAAATLGKSMGKSEADVRKMVTAGKIDFKTFSDAMDTAFGAHATEANKTYAGALSNMKAALSRIGASFFTPWYEGQRRVLNAFSPLIDNVAKAIKPAIDAFGEFTLLRADKLAASLKKIDLTVLTKTIPIAVQIIKNVMAAFGSIIAPIKDAFQQIFPAPTVATIVTLAIKIAAFTANLKLGADAADKVKRTFAGLFAIFDIIGQVISGVIGVFGKLIGTIVKGSGGFLDFTAGVGDWLVKLDTAIKEGGKLTDFFDKLGNVLVIPIKFLQAIGAGIQAAFSHSGEILQTGKVVERFGQRLSPLKKLIDLIGAAWEGFVGFIANSVPMFRTVIDKIAAVFGGLGNALADAIKNGNYKLLLDTINTTLFATITAIITRFFSKGVKVDFGGAGIIGKIKANIGALTGTFRAMQQQLKAKTLIELAGAIALIVGSIVVLSLIDSAKLTVALAALGVVFAQLLGGMAILSKIAGSAGFIKLPIISASLILFSTAILILSAAVKVLSTMSWQELAKGLGSIAVLLGILSVAMEPLTKNSAGLIAASAGLILLGVALTIIAGAVAIFGNMNLDTLAKGLGSVVVALVLIADAMKLMPLTLPVTAAGLVLVGLALNLVAAAVKIFSSLSWEEMGKGLVGLAGSLLIIAGAMALMGGPSLIVTAAGLVLVGVALNLIAPALKVMSSMSWEEIAKGLVALAGSLAILAAGMYLMSGALPGAAALLVISAALTIFVPVLMALGSMSWDAIAHGLGALAGAFIVIGVAGLLISPVVLPILAFAAAVTLLGVGVLFAGAGIFLFAAAITLLVAAGSLGVAALTAIFQTVIAMIPQAMLALQTALIAFAAVIISVAPAYVAAIVVVLVALMDAIIKLIPKIRKTLSVLLDNMIALLITYIPKLVDAGYKILNGILKGIGDNIYKMITLATKIITEFIRGIGDNAPKVVKEAAATIIKFINGISAAIDANSEALGRAAGKLGVSIIKGIVNGIKGGIGSVIDAAKDMASSALDAAKNFLHINSPSKVFMEVGGSITEGLATGIDKYSDEVIKPTEAMAKKALTTLSESMAHVSDVVSGDMEFNPIITPVLDLDSFKKDAASINGILTPDQIVPTTSAQNGSIISQTTKDDKAKLDEAANGAALGSSIQFIQTNNSPKALSAAEIYRQTKNQLSMVKGALPS